MKLLLAADLHIGRASTRVPASVDRNELRAVSAWKRMVDLAIEEQVAAVCLAGDIADEANKFWEAIGPLERGVRRLEEHGIRTVAVAGNHDHDVLVRLANQLPVEHFTLVGRGGRWERITLQHDGRPALHIDGWSFSGPRVPQSPLTRYDLPQDASLPVLGMAHGDLDSAVTPYAPLDKDTLLGLPPAAWLLGHIHAPRLLKGHGDGWLLYPGSPQAMDPGETGAHGVWICEVKEGRICWPEQRVQSTVWYDECAIDLEGAADQEEVEARLLDGIRAAGNQIAEKVGTALQHVSLRVRLTGHTATAGRVSGVAKDVVADLRLTAGQASVDVDQFSNETLPAIDLNEYAGSRSAAGALAALLLDLERAELKSETVELVRAARHKLEQMEQHKDFMALDRRDVTETMAREQVRAQARRLLTQLVVHTQ